MRNYSYGQLCQLYSQCHKDDGTCKSVMEWIHSMMVLLGPDDCKGFLIRTRDRHLKGLFLSPHTRCDWVPRASEAKIFEWGITAVKCTNNRKLEAIRVNENNVAVDSSGKQYDLSISQDIPLMYEQKNQFDIF